MVCVADPLLPVSLIVALIGSGPVALLVKVLEATPPRLLGATGEKSPESVEKRTPVPSATSAPLTEALARTAIGEPAVNTLSAAVGSVI